MRNGLGKELVMPKKGFSAEQIVTMLRQIEVSMSHGKSTRVLAGMPGKAAGPRAA
jgi:hypothetical protein